MRAARAGAVQRVIDMPAIAHIPSRSVETRVRPASDDRWPPGKALVFAVGVSAILWAVLLSPLFLFNL